ncbi:TetR family transcriptional regulator [Rubrobacter marinus]|uniref:TetR family transcriptional regulator n=1 Tax=Rubrobacter marinus TaxID=2653852 RepID=A0A6G8PSI5_9ACTN|nr:TetR/AcrR family transcriptional regulator [Rubrobacter marinus]QIN77458.1 TetR family transcriptional regulator [Rubrobacter marinus]
MKNRAKPTNRQGGAVTAEKLREEAARLFWEKGYAATTTREIAESLGVQRASIYYHIESKEELLYDLCVESLRNIRSAVATAVADKSDPLDRVRAMIRAHVVSMLEDREKHATMLTELRALSAPRRAEIVRLRDEYESLVRAIVSEAQEAGVLWKEASAKELELALLNLLNWTIFWYRTDGELSPEDLAKLFEKIYLGGVART